MLLIFQMYHHKTEQYSYWESKMELSLSFKVTDDSGRFSICGRTDIGYHGKNQIKWRERVLFQQNYSLPSNRKSMN